MIIVYGVLCPRNGVMAMLHRRLYKVLFQAILLMIRRTVGEIYGGSGRRIIRLNLTTTCYTPNRSESRCGDLVAAILLLLEHF